MRAVILEGSAVNPGDISWAPVEALCETSIYESCTEAEKWERLEGADLVLTNKIVMDEAVFSRYPGLKYVGVCATGYDVVDLEAARRHGVTVCNVPAYSTESVVQFTFALLLELCSGVAEHDASVRRGDWVRSENFCYWLRPLTELSGKTMGIYGFGNIGRGVANVAQALGMNVLVHTLHPERYLSYMGPRFRFADAASLFKHADVLSFHCPLTEETRGIICADNLKKMKPGALLLNVSRGGLVVEEALAEALRSGPLAAAAMDVLPQEPMRADSPLLGLPNLILTPHIAWASREARTRLVAVVAENIAAYLRGEPQHVVS